MATRDKTRSGAVRAKRRKGSDRLHETIDRSVMFEITAGDEGLERDLFRHFRKVNDEDAALLRSGVVTSDVALIVHSSHRMKGAAQAIGARRLALACQDLERTAREGRLDAVHEAMPVLESELYRVNLFLDALELRPVGTPPRAVPTALEE